MNKIILDCNKPHKVFDLVFNKGCKKCVLTQKKNLKIIKDDRL